MKIIIFGSNGMLGTYMYNYFKNIYETTSYTRKDYDLSKISYEELYKLLSHTNNTFVVINCVGLIPQRGIENYTDYISINSAFPQMLARISLDLGFKFIHITTDCVFDGLKGNYDENDDHTAQNIYGISKSLGENKNATIIRTSIIGEELNNKKSLIEFVKNNKNINGYTNHIWNGVSCLCLVEIIHHMIKNNIYWKGVKHIFSETVTKYELVCMINKIYGLNVIINPCEDHKYCNRTLKSIYDPFYEVPSLYDQLVKQKNFYN